MVKCGDRTRGRSTHQYRRYAERTMRARLAALRDATSTDARAAWTRRWLVDPLARTRRSADLVAGGIDLASVKAAMGHARISATERYLHPRPAGELADRFTAALGGGAD